MKFVKLTQDTANVSPLYVNLDRVAIMLEDFAGGRTILRFDNELFSHVKETPDQILALARKR